ncbi:PhoX family protein [Myroides pelagicus]|uniref:DUF839 domain-containing protein n=1 Tax=Myroides pelagicus TaxID=270914 RepID=A0A7K1GNN6_9FLAO|nr:hypothetical protein [Myroides pelagicus]MEC4114228.1 hypothetical protein [Myroides pelagicus]MTH30398.1 hypothetical protein [Myroides pelagicus]
MRINNKLSIWALSLVLSAVSASCNNDDSTGETPKETAVELKDHSKTPAFVYAMPGFENLEIFTLISSEDKLEESPEFVFGGQPDGAGFMKDPNSDGYLMITNHEKMQSVSRVYLDKTFKPVKGEYIVDGIGGITRLCSATLAKPEVHGFGPMFLTAGESGQESMVHAIDPMGSTAEKSRTDRVLPALGKASMENAVPLPTDVSNGKTIIMIGEDQGYGSNHQSAGQLVMYVGERGDLENGKLYALKRKSGGYTEMDMSKGNEYDVEFVEIDGAKNMTGAQINQANMDLGVIRFSRVEDVDYRKGAGNGNEIYFTATGQASGRTTPVDGFTMWGRVYKLVLDKDNMMTGKLSVAAEGDSDPGNNLINPDNLCVTENYVYIQEDGDSYYNESKHDSYIWQYKMADGTYKPWLNMQHKRGDAEWHAKYNQSGNLDKFGSWEFGAMEDVSDLVGIPNTFSVNIHSHTWQDDAFVDADKAGVNTNKEGGQVVLIRNVQN